jgi:hypothetical protein
MGYAARQNPRSLDGAKPEREVLLARIARAVESGVRLDCLETLTDTERAFLSRTFPHDMGLDD